MKTLEDGSKHILLEPTKAEVEKADKIAMAA